MTLYRALYGKNDLWVRPAAMIEAEVVIYDVLQPRFVKDYKPIVLSAYWLQRQKAT